MQHTCVMHIIPTHAGANKKCGKWRLRQASIVGSNKIEIFSTGALVVAAEIDRVLCLCQSVLSNTMHNLSPHNTKFIQNQIFCFPILLKKLMILLGNTCKISVVLGWQLWCGIINSNWRPKVLYCIDLRGNV